MTISKNPKPPNTFLVPLRCTMFTTSTHVKLDDCEKVTFNVMISKRAPLFPTPSHRQQSTHEVLKRLTSFNPTQLAESLVAVEVSGVLCEKFLHSPNDDDDGTVSFGVGSKLETVQVVQLVVAAEGCRWCTRTNRYRIVYSWH